MVFSREAFEAALPDGGEAPHGVHGGSPALPVASSVDPGALGEILSQAAKARAPDAPPREPRDARDARDGGVGSDTGLPPDPRSHPSPHADPLRTPRVRVGSVTVEAGMATPAMERAARAQLYWPLVQRCRDDAGAILPPEVVHLSFVVDRDGYIAPATVVQQPKSPPYAAAARCMAREIGVLPFRLPAAARGLPQRVEIDLPSVD